MIPGLHRLNERASERERSHGSFSFSWLQYPHLPPIIGDCQWLNDDVYCMQFTYFVGASNKVILIPWTQTSVLIPWTQPPTHQCLDGKLAGARQSPPLPFARFRRSLIDLTRALVVRACAAEAMQDPALIFHCPIPIHHRRSVDRSHRNSKPARKNDVGQGPREGAACSFSYSIHATLHNIARQDRRDIAELGGNEIGQSKGRVQIWIGVA